MNSLVKHEAHVPSTDTSNPFAAYAAAAAAEGTPFLKFVKGEFLFGVDSEVLPPSTRLVADIANMRSGWIRWWDGKPTEERMSRIADGWRIVAREELGDDDPRQWQTNNGTPVDPWQRTDTLQLKCSETGQEFLFTTGSKGGIGALGKLATAYYRQLGGNERRLPIVELGSSFYKHKTYGQVHYPVFKIVEWRDEQALIAGEESGVADDLDDSVPW